MLKTFAVSIDDFEYAQLVAAENAGKAKAWAMREYGVEFTDVRVRRKPSADGKADFTDRDYVEAGLCMECDRPRCPNEVYPVGTKNEFGDVYPPPVFGSDGKCYCSNYCREQAEWFTAPLV